LEFIPKKQVSLPLLFLNNNKKIVHERIEQTEKQRRPCFRRAENREPGCGEQYRKIMFFYAG
jgi:hypothetical protein